MGIGALPAGNRLERAVIHLEEFNRDFPQVELFTEDDSERGSVVADAVRTVFEAFVVAFAIERHSGRERFEDKHFNAFIDGADVEVVDSPSAARSHQFEAFVLAQFVLGGTSARSSEPDILLEYHSRTVGLAVKRVRTRNENSIQKHLTIGARQIRDHVEIPDLRGYVVLSLDPWIDNLDFGSDATKLGKAFRDDIKEAYAKLELLEDRIHVMGVILTGTWTGWRFDSETPRFVWKSPHLFQGLTTPPNTAQEEREFQEFFDAFVKRWNGALGELGALLTFD